MKLLNDSSREPAVLDDVDGRRAWLLPKLSVIHHMVLAYSKCSMRSVCAHQLPLAKPRPDGEHASFMALSRQSE
jgi:hypothetical protein